MHKSEGSLQFYEIAMMTTSVRLIKLLSGDRFHQLSSLHFIYNLQDCLLKRSILGEIRPKMHKLEVSAGTLEMPILLIWNI